MNVLDESIKNSLRLILNKIDGNPNREGLKDTPERILKSWDHLFSGYKIPVKSIFKEFDKPKAYQQIILLKNIEFYSTCEHHFLPFLGKVHIAYIPNKRVIGVSKLVRLVEVYSRRLQIQERICEQVTETLMEHLEPKSAACIIEAKHLCMMARGVEKQNAVMVTSSLKGTFIKDPKAREELMRLIS